MFNIFKSKSQGKEISLKISGMHCTSCSLSIDGEMEELEGIFSSNTSYAKTTTKIDYDPKVIKLNQIKKSIVKLGYKVVD